MKALELISTGAALPKREVTNEMLSQTVDTNDEWIRERTGIRSRRFCGEDENNTSLAINAAKQAMERSGLGTDDISVIVVATLSAEYATPSAACLIQQALGFPENIPALDVNAACTGFMYGVSVALGLLHVNNGKYALVVGVEELSRLTDMTDRNTCVLFGDGAGAGVFKVVEDGLFQSVLGSRGSKVLTAPGPAVSNSYIKMDGPAVFRFAVEAIRHCVDEILQKENITLDEVDHVVCHQANERIIDHCIKKYKARPGQFFKNVDHTGNTSAASIPLALNEMYETGVLKSGDNLLCVGFGGGLTWAGTLLKYTGGNYEASK